MSLTETFELIEDQELIGLISGNSYTTGIDILIHEQRRFVCSAYWLNSNNPTMNHENADLILEGLKLDLEVN